MALVVQALILCTTDNVEEAESAVFQALNGASFDSDSPVLDFALGVEHRVTLSADYADGGFLQHIPAAALLKPVNSIHLPS